MRQNKTITPITFRYTKTPRIIHIDIYENIIGLFNKANNIITMRGDIVKVEAIYNLT